MYGDILKVTVYQNNMWIVDAGLVIVWDLTIHPVSSVIMQLSGEGRREQMQPMQQMQRTRPQNTPSAAVEAPWGQIK